MTETSLATRVFEGWEIDASIGDPLVRDTDIAVRAGLAQPRDVRRVIEKNRAELEMHGDLSMRACQARIEKTGAIRGFETRAVNEYWLNEAQALNLVALMRTERAAALRVGLVRLFVAWRKGAAAPPAALALDVATGPRIGEHPTLRADLERQCRLAARASGRTVHAVHGLVRRVMRVPGVYQLPVLAWEFARRLLDSIALGEIAIPSRKKAPVLQLVDRRQLPLPLPEVSK